MDYNLISLRKPRRVRGFRLLRFNSAAGMNVALTAVKQTGAFMNRLLIIAILVISTVPLYAQGQQPNVAKLKGDAQKVVSIISGDKAKTQTYCQIAKLSEQVDQAAQEKDRKKAEELVRKINELEKQLGPEYSALVDALFNNNMDPNSKDIEEIVSMFDRFDESCRTVE